MIPFYRLAFNLFHIKTLLDSYVDVQMARIEMASAQQDGSPPSQIGQDGMNWRTVQVVLPNKQGYAYAKVCDEDYLQVVGISPKWRKSSSGYAIHVYPTGETVYMHKLIHGGPAKHLNGDRLDNRRENLCNTIKKRKTEFTIQEPETKLHIDQFNTYKSTDPVLACVNGFCKVEFPKGKYYVGNVEGGIPHGYGTMFKREPPYEIDGMWERGSIQTGLMKNMEYVPRCMCPDSHPCPFRKVLTVTAIHRGFRI